MFWQYCLQMFDTTSSKSEIRPSHIIFMFLYCHFRNTWLLLSATITTHYRGLLKLISERRYSSFRSNEWDRANYTCNLPCDIYIILHFIKGEENQKGKTYHMVYIYNTKHRVALLPGHTRNGPCCNFDFTSEVGTQTQHGYWFLLAAILCSVRQVSSISTLQGITSAQSIKYTLEAK